MYVSRKRFEEDFKVDQGLTQEQIDEFLRIVMREATLTKENIDYTKYNKWFGNSDGSAWCAAFVVWCAYQAGMSDFPKEASVWNLAMAFINSGLSGDEKVNLRESGKENYNNSYNGVYFSRDDYTPRAGDLIIFGRPLIDGVGGDGHIGIVVAYDAENGIVYTVEGNYGSRISNGYDSYYKTNDERITAYISMGENSYGTIPKKP